MTEEMVLLKKFNASYKDLSQINQSKE